MKYFVVIDTNVIVSGMMSATPNSSTVKVLELFFTKNIIPLYSDEIIEEYKSILNRPKFKIRSSYIGKFINVLKKNGVKISPQSIDVTLPDNDDVIFYELVMDKTFNSNKYLITGNIKDYIKSPIIITPDEFIKIYENSL